jgi:hypothetical protein
MEFALLQNDYSEQASPISEGAAEIQINIILQGTNLTTRHTWVTQAPWVVTVHDDYQRVESGPPYHSAGFLHDTSMDIRGWPHTIPMSPVKYNGVLSNSASVEATKFTGPHKSHMCQYIINLIHRGQTIGPQLTQTRATTFRVLNIKIDHSHPFHPVFSTLP